MRSATGVGSDPETTADSSQAIRFTLAKARILPAVVSPTGAPPATAMASRSGTLIYCTISLAMFRWNVLLIAYNSGNQTWNRRIAFRGENMDSDTMLFLEGRVFEPVCATR
jgi:hypothetical protein